MGRLRGNNGIAIVVAVAAADVAATTVDHRPSIDRTSSDNSAANALFGFDPGDSTAERTIDSVAIITTAT